MQIKRSVFKLCSTAPNEYKTFQGRRLDIHNVQKTYKRRIKEVSVFYLNEILVIFKASLYTHRSKSFYKVEVAGWPLVFKRQILFGTYKVFPLIFSYCSVN